MATVKRLLNADGTVRGYKVRYRLSGRSHSRTFPKGFADDAKAFAGQVEADKAAGLGVDPRGLRVPLDIYAGEWLAVLAVREGSAARVEDSLILLRRMLGRRPVGKIRQSDVRAWVKARAGQVQPSTLRNDWWWVRALFRAALADRLRGDNPCDGIRLERTPRRQMVVPPPEGVAAIAARLPAAWAFLGPLGARTGLRPAELLGLCNEQVDWLRREVRVDRQMVAGQVKLEPKTAYSVRSVPLDDETVERLAAHLAAQPLGPPVTVFERKAGQLVAGGTGRLVFHRPGGGPIAHRSVTDTWARHATRAGYPGVRVHDMRHFYASNLLGHGVPVAEVAELLGHSSPAITAGVYAHALPGRDARTRAAVTKIFEPRPERVLGAGSADG